MGPNYHYGAVTAEQAEIERGREELVFKNVTKVTDPSILYSCNLCGTISKNKSAMRDHVEGKHLQAAGLEYLCPYCERTFNAQAKLRKHVSHNHREVHQMVKLKL